MRIKVYFKRKEFLRNMIIIVIIQIAIIMLACTSFAGRERATSANTTKVIFHPDEVLSKHTVGIGRLSQSESSIIIIHNSIRYIYEDECDGWHLREDLLDNLAKEKLYISYMTETYRIVDIRSDTNVYYTIYDYNSEQMKQIAMGCILLSVVEIIFLGIIFLDVAMNLSRRKRTKDK